jgi:hypothetical protein
MESMSPVMQEADFETAFNHLYAVVEGVIKQGGEVHPVVLGLKMAKNHSIARLAVLDVADMMGDPEGKDQLAQAMFGLVQSPDLDIVAHVSEAWYLVKDAEGPEGLSALSGSISTEPDKMEGVIIFLLSKDSEVLALNPIQREPSPRLEKGNLDFTQMLRGRFSRESVKPH